VPSGVAPILDATRLGGVVLCCGIYDPTALRITGPFQGRLGCGRLAYSGSRDYRANTFFTSTTAVPRHVTSAVPATFITVGNVDPLLRQSQALADVLREKGVELDALFYADDYRPPLGHEYEFDLDLADGRTAFNRIVAFAKGHTSLA
jgi:acetyl esterase